MTKYFPDLIVTIIAASFFGFWRWYQHAENIVFAMALFGIIFFALGVIFKKLRNAK